MQVHFVPRENGPERLVTEAEIHFDKEGPLTGTRIVEPVPLRTLRNPCVEWSRDSCRDTVP
jgi:hypothetical protein